MYRSKAHHSNLYCFLQLCVAHPSGSWCRILPHQLVCRSPQAGGNFCIQPNPPWFSFPPLLGRPSPRVSSTSTLPWSPASSSSCGTFHTLAWRWRLHCIASSLLYSDLSYSTWLRACLRNFFCRYFLNVIFNILNKKIYNYFPYP